MNKSLKQGYREAEIAVGLNCFGFLLFNVSHWMFAFKYFSITRQMPFKLASLQVPRTIVICDRINNGLFFSLNCIAPILTATFYITGMILGLHVNLRKEKPFWRTGDVFYMITLSLPIITGSYLFVALYFIIKSTKKRNNYEVNVVSMFLHASSFALYMISTAIVVIRMSIRMKDPEAEQTMILTLTGVEELKNTQIVALIFSSLSQCVLCIIFWSLGQKGQPYNKPDYHATERSGLDEILRTEEDYDEVWKERTSSIR